MSEKILVKTDLLERCAGELKSAASGFGDAASILASLNTSQDWWQKIGGFSALRLQDEGSSTSIGTARDAVYSMTGALRRYDNRAVRLGNSVSRAADLFRETENRLGGRLDGSLGPVISGGGVKGPMPSWGHYKIPEPVITDSGGMLPKNKTPWWGFFRGGLVKVGPLWNLGVESYNLYKKFKEGKADGYELAKYGLKVAKPFVKWADWYFKHTDKSALEKLNKFLFNVGDPKTGLSVLKEGPNPIDVVFSAITTGIDNYKEYKTGKISGDRAIVEWRTEFGLDVLKTWGISAAGTALGGLVVGALVATPPGWVVAAAGVAGTAVVAGVYCAADWAWKTYLSPNKDSKGLISDAGHYMGELYDWGKKKASEVGKKAIDGAKKLADWASSRIKVKWAFSF